jgi:hypothetical protein
MNILKMLISKPAIPMTILASMAKHALADSNKNEIIASSVGGGIAACILLAICCCLKPRNRHRNAEADIIAPATLTRSDDPSPSIVVGCAPAGVVSVSISKP